MCKRKAAAVNMTKEWVVILVKLRIPLRRHTGVPHDDVHTVRNVEFHLPSGKGALVDAQPVVRIVGNTGRIRTTDLAFARQRVQDFVLGVSAQALLKVD